MKEYDVIVQTTTRLRIEAPDDEAAARIVLAGAFAKVISETLPQVLEVQEVE